MFPNNGVSALICVFNEGMELMRVFVITGISSGLGEKIVKELISNKEMIIGIGRRLNQYQKLESQSDNNQFHFLECDLSKSSDVTNLSTRLEKLLRREYSELIFINNAGIIEPINKIGQFSNNDTVYEHINVNYTSPVIIINSLVSLLDENMKLKILNISSGAAERAIEGWGLYCSTKRAIKMFLDVLNNENNNVDIKHIDPGVMNTKMQKMIRNSQEGDFPSVNQFRKYKEAGNLLNPGDVALRILEEYIN